MSKYILITSQTASGLQLSVLKKVALGWKPYGMPVSRGDNLNQAMVKGDFPADGYRVLTSETASALQRLVRKYTDAGWVPLGVPVARKGNILQAIISGDAVDVNNPFSSASGGLLACSPDIETIEYNGRRGDGLPSGQGWATSNATFTAVENDDGRGGHVLSVEKTTGSIWTVSRTVSEGADMLVYGGELSLRFRITDSSATNNRYAIGMYWLLDNIPDGVSFDRQGTSTTPALVNFIIQTDETNIYVYLHCNAEGADTISNIKLATIGAFDNEWHELRVVYKGGNTADALLYIDGGSPTEYTLKETPARVENNTIEVNNVTVNETYNVELELIAARIFRDDGTVVLSGDDVSSLVWFPDDERGGKVVLPDATISPGNTVKILSDGSGPVTISPSGTRVLIIPAGETKAYPSSVETAGNVTLVQTSSEGRTWRVLGEAESS
ncbi:hypothetical protein AOY57_24140 [Escherichia coli]|uniref:DUF6645 domain-containing protein n=1 Tax=Escherichia coli TaxID=562 RepID=UPI0019181E9D|nr:DUF6645 domain-containing protein [Escherichia coli]UMT24992.1 hypothetical protein AOY57_24140 [Escherichia coli]CAD6136453.1 YjhS [Escherichia coli]